MTTVFERTRSVIETSGFLLRLTRDQSLPDAVRSEAKQLLRHYPTADAVRLAGRWEAIRQHEVSKLPGSPRALHPALATWPLVEPMFCDLELPDAPELGAHPDWANFPALHPTPSAAGGVRILGPAKSIGMSCLSIEYRCFISARSAVLACATTMLGSRAKANSWFVDKFRGLEYRRPCTMMSTVHDFSLVMDGLFRIVYGSYL